MRKWFVIDRNGNEIYLTEQQWEHIISGHGELRRHHADVLTTVRLGHRQQQPKNPQTYVYRWGCDSLPPPFNGILVVVAFRFEQQADISQRPNNFMITAWGIMMRQKG